MFVIRKYFHYKKNILFFLRFCFCFLSTVLKETATLNTIVITLASDMFLVSKDLVSDIE